MKRFTVSAIHREWGEHHKLRHAHVPQIRLTGWWLAKCGFDSGTSFVAQVEGGALVLRPVSQAPLS